MTQLASNTSIRIQQSEALPAVLLFRSVLVYGTMPVSFRGVILPSPSFMSLNFSFHSRRQSEGMLL